MFKVKEYSNIENYMKRTALTTSTIIFILSIGLTKTNFIVSLLSLYLLVTYMIIKSLAIMQSVNVTEEKNTKFSWLTRTRYSA